MTATIIKQSVILNAAEKWQWGSVCFIYIAYARNSPFQLRKNRRGIDILLAEMSGFLTQII